MSPTPSKLGPAPASARLSALALFTLFASVGCAPSEESTEESTSDDMAMEESSDMAMDGGDAMAAGDAPAMSQDAPVCSFTASGDELTGRASPPDSASAQVGTAVAKVCYGAPSMRDREIMGGLVPFGEPWRIGANEPTTIHLPVAARIGSVDVEPGSYSLFSIPGDSEWEIVVNSNVDRWGIPIDDAVRESDIGSFTVEPESLDAPVERLSIQMVPAGEGADIVVEWETTRITIPVQPL